MNAPVSRGSRTRARRFAAIDIGSNTLRSMIVEAAPGENYRILDTEKVPSRLGEGVAVQGVLSPAARVRTLEGLAYLKQIADGHGCDEIAVIGTSAMRDAADGRRFLEEIRRTLRLPARIIDGEEEARLALRSALHAFHLRNERFALMDIGGGSAEVVISVGKVIESIHSLPLGAVRLTEEFVTEDPPPRRDLRRMKQRVREVLRESLGRSAGVGLLVASGGSAGAVVRLALGMSGAAGAGSAAKVHGVEITRARVEHVYELVRELDAAGRRKLRGLSSHRVDIIVAGALVVREAMRVLEANRILINEGGVRDGLVLEMIERAFPRAQRADAAAQGHPLESARRFARACRYEPEHAEAVRGFGVTIFDALAPLHGLGGTDREVLELAAILHDVGYFVEYGRHHRHSYHLISHAHLAGIDRRRQELTALVARYHRRALPKERHLEFSRLPPADRIAVRWLSAILRVADGLDRSHAQRVREIGVQIGPDDIHVRLLSPERAELEIWGALRKSDLLEALSGRKVEIAQSARGPRRRDGGTHQG